MTRSTFVIQLKRRAKTLVSLRQLEDVRESGVLILEGKHTVVLPKTYFTLKAKYGDTQCNPSIREPKAEMIGRGQPGYRVSFRLPQANQRNCLKLQQL